MLGAAADLRALAQDPATPSGVAKALAEIAGRIEGIAAVGMPPRGHQFTASEQLLLHRHDLARNSFRDPSRGVVDVPADCRGLTSALVDELSRVRTDLDALEPPAVELLMPQGYFLTESPRVWRRLGYLSATRSA